MNSAAKNKFYYLFLKGKKYISFPQDVDYICIDKQNIFF